MAPGAMRRDPQIAGMQLWGATRRRGSSDGSKGGEGMVVALEGCSPTPNLNRADRPTSATSAAMPWQDYSAHAMAGVGGPVSPSRGAVGGMPDAVRLAMCFLEEGRRFWISPFRWGRLPNHHATCPVPVQT